MKNLKNGKGLEIVIDLIEIVLYFKKDYTPVYIYDDKNKDKNDKKSDNNEKQANEKELIG